MYASDGLNGKVRCLAAAQRLCLLVAEELGNRLGNAFAGEAVVREDLGARAGDDRRVGQAQALDRTRAMLCLLYTSRCV